MKKIGLFLLLATKIFAQGQPATISCEGSNWAAAHWQFCVDTASNLWLCSNAAGCRNNSDFISISAGGSGNLTGSGTQNFLPVWSTQTALTNSLEQISNGYFVIGESNGLQIGGSGQSAVILNNSSGVAVTPVTGQSIVCDTVSGTTCPLKYTTTPVTANSSAGHATCWKTSSSISYCESVVASDGTCTCH